jgi:hypothetical protein
MPATGPAPIYLTILRKGDLNIVDLAEVGSLIARSETQAGQTRFKGLEIRGVERGRESATRPACV